MTPILLIAIKLTVSIVKGNWPKYRYPNLCKYITLEYVSYSTVHTFVSGARRSCLVAVNVQFRLTYQKYVNMYKF